MEINHGQSQTMNLSRQQRADTFLTVAFKLAGLHIPPKRNHRISNLPGTSDTLVFNECDQPGKGYPH